MNLTRRIPWLDLIGIAATLLAIALVCFTTLPLGWLGEWVWNRSTAPPLSWPRWVIPGIGAAQYLAVVILLGRWQERRSDLWLGLLFPILLASAALWHWSLADLPGPGRGMERWPISIDSPATSGYLAVARSNRDAAAFLRQYDKWVASADQFHLGTHPPGLILISQWVLDSAEQGLLANWDIERIAPTRLLNGFEFFAEPLSPIDRKAILFIALGTWWISLLTTLPLYLLGRFGTAGGSEGGEIAVERRRRCAWWAASLWPAVPASLVFVPVADSLYPLVTMTALLLAVLAYQWRVGLMAILAGAIVWIGMMLSLAHLVTFALIAGSLLFMSIGDRRIVRGIWLIVCCAAGSALPTALLHVQEGINLVDIWRINLAKHASFYEAMPRSYFPWLGINLIELAIMSSPALAIWAFMKGITRGWRSHRPAIDRWLLAWVLIVVALDLSGRNRSETARLWLFLVPMAVLGGAAAQGDRRGRWGLSAGLVGAMVLHAAITGWVEPLLPIPLPP